MPRIWSPMRRSRMQAEHRASEAPHGAMGEETGETGSETERRQRANVVSLKQWSAAELRNTGLAQRRTVRIGLWRMKRSGGNLRNTCSNTLAHIHLPECACSNTLVQIHLLKILTLITTQTLPLKKNKVHHFFLLGEISLEGVRGNLLIKRRFPCPFRFPLPRLSLAFPNRAW